MIEIASERLVTLTRATRHLPERRCGKKPSPATLWRWATKGCKGIILETLMVGGTRCTSLEALQRYFDALTAAAESGQPPVSQSPLLTKSRQRQIEEAERRLAAQA